MQAANPRRGYILGLTAYVIWGIFPLYFKLLASVPAAEIIVNRVLWSALFGSLLLLVWKHPGWWQELRDNPKRLGVLTISGLLMTTTGSVFAIVPPDRPRRAPEGGAAWIATGVFGLFAAGHGVHLCQQGSVPCTGAAGVLFVVRG